MARDGKGAGYGPSSTGERFPFDASLESAHLPTAVPSWGHPVYVGTAVAQGAIRTERGAPIGDGDRLYVRDGENQVWD